MWQSIKDLEKSQHTAISTNSWGSKVVDKHKNNEGN